MPNAPAKHPHAIMFHHFYSDQHPRGAGAISAQRFSQIIDWIAQRYDLLDADDFAAKLVNRTLTDRSTCLTFDDALLCQAEIALPVLQSKRIKAFFFVYSSPFCGEPDYLEIYRFFRTTEFAHVDDFYKAFFAETRRLLGAQAFADCERCFDAEDYLKSYGFYTSNDKWFRFLRDDRLTRDDYQSIMLSLMRRYRFEPGNCLSRLWMNDGHLRQLETAGHIVGLHSYSHPTFLHKLDISIQHEEYRRNYAHLSSVLRIPPTSMSHPCGNYTHETLAILQKFGIQIGFRADLAIKTLQSDLEIPREDHANLLARVPG